MSTIVAFLPLISCVTCSVVNAGPATRLRIMGHSSIAPLKNAIVIKKMFSTRNCTEGMSRRRRARIIE
jgi:hypothetical protein